MPGRRIFKITATPFGSFARCTCAIEAAAKGSRSRSTKTSKGERPSACSTCGQSSSKETGVAWLCSAASSVVHAGGSRSSRVESIWPSLTKVGREGQGGRRWAHHRACRVSQEHGDCERRYRVHGTARRRVAGPPSPFGSTPHPGQVTRPGPERGLRV